MKQSIFVKMITGPNGSVSSKRTTMFALLFVFITGYFVNLFTGRHPSDLFMEQLYYLVLTAVAAVFGDNVIKATKDIKIATKDKPEIKVINNEAEKLTQVNVPETITTELK